MDPIQEVKPVSTRTIPYARGEQLIRVEIDVRPAVYPIDGGFVLNAGKNIVVIRREQLAALEALVETDLDAIEAAKRTHARRLERHIEDAVEPFRVAGKSDLEIAACATDARDTYSGSWQAVHQEESRRGVRPFISVRTSGAAANGVTLGPVENPEDRKHNDEESLRKSEGAADRSQLAELVAAAIAQTLPSAVAAAVQALQPAAAAAPKKG